MSVATCQADKVAEFTRTEPGACVTTRAHLLARPGRDRPRVFPVRVTPLASYWAVEVQLLAAGGPIRSSDPPLKDHEKPVTARVSLVLLGWPRRSSNPVLRES